ncbi:DNA mismatch repair endonuclease MutH [Shewanella sp. 3B26]|uniref:DNA mismatch repair protein MutH n=1 Tax=Shewanella zhuhaiensis TaxID=2919576 RepID=A0AAJ1EZG3_9GAMM|nr:DNA mismatch repair endonuclease MutH [Shewanella zhuhaiensis]MCH4293253.1 DNA mismatch repair endonuclease MutH [Shewanella zhuhaiensis]
MNAPRSPQSLEELLDRAHQMAGLSLGQLAAGLGWPVPANLRRDKGWIGQLIEQELGALAGSRPEQDFLHLGVELKTIPIDSRGKPLETTYVCVAPLMDVGGLKWEQSLVKHKLEQVLWIPVEGERSIPLTDRRIGTPVLWRPSMTESEQLRQDWEEIMELIAIGKVTGLTARHGEVLQLRPKAANAAAKTECIMEDGTVGLTNPRGFYLKTNFTQAILRQAFGE